MVLKFFLQFLYLSIQRQIRMIIFLFIEFLGKERDNIDIWALFDFNNHVICLYFLIGFDHCWEGLNRSKEFPNFVVDCCKGKLLNLKSLWINISEYIFKFIISIDYFLVFYILQFVLLYILPKCVQYLNSSSLLHSHYFLQRTFNLEFWRVVYQVEFYYYSLLFISFWQPYHESILFDEISWWFFPLC